MNVSAVVAADAVVVEDDVDNGHNFSNRVEVTDE